MRGIVYTRHDGGVSVTYPTPEIFRVMQNGGFWDDRPRGFIDTQIERQIASGIDPDHARRFARAVAFGGVTEAEAWEIIRDRDCARHGTMHELIDPSELPDRWFRDAWSRSANGGPVGVSLSKARPIQWRKIITAVQEENKKRELDLFGPAPLKINKAEYQTAINHARDAEELRKIWITSLPQL
jgi:hypothetical protein